jgi:hypothetical protein
MAVTSLRIRRRVTGSPGAPATLKTAELAYNMVDGLFYVGFGDDGGGNATSIKVFAEDDYVSPVGVYQPIDGTLTALSGASWTAGTQVLALTAADTVTLQTVGQAAGNILNKTAGDALYQPLDGDLTAFAGLDATAGFLTKTAANTYSRRTITGTAGRIGVTNGDGVSGNPTVDLSTVTIGGSGSGSNFTKVSVDTYGRITNTATASLTDISPPTATWSAGAQLLQSSATPSGSNDLTNKAYVDQAILNANLAGDTKDSVRAATTANITLSAPQTIDGVSVIAGDRVLVKNQTTTSANGIYVVAAGAWTRATDFDAWSEVPGAIVAVEEGSTLGDSVWMSTANAGGTLNTTPISFARIDAGAGGGFTVAGAGLSSSGATIDVVAGTGITVGADTVALAGQALALHNVVTAADQLIYATGVSTFAATGFSSVARTLVSQTTQALMRSTGLGLGTIATQDASNVAITGGTIDGVTIDGGTF